MCLSGFLGRAGVQPVGHNTCVRQGSILHRSYVGDDDIFVVLSEHNSGVLILVTNALNNNVPALPIQILLHPVLIQALRRSTGCPSSDTTDTTTIR